MLKLRKNKTGIKRSKEDLIFDIITYIISGILLIIAIYPMYFVVIASFSDPTAVSLGKVNFLPKGFSTKGYKTLFEYKEIWTGYKNTIIYSVLGTITSLSVNIPAGYALSRKDLYGKKYIRFLYIIPMFFGGGMVPTYLAIKSYGMIDTVWAMILPGVACIFYIIVARSFFETSMPEELWEAAQVDGIGNIGYFFRIVIPLSKAIIAVIALWTAVGQWNSYFNALIYLKSPDLKPLQVVLRSILIDSQTASTMMTGTSASEARELAELVKYSSIVVSSLPIMTLYPFLQKYFNQGVMVGSLKG